MGFDIERFIGDVNEGLLCSICRDVLEEPLLAPCEHTFCSACIHTWLTHYNSCPEDRQRLWPSDLKPIFRYMKNDLDRLTIRCDNELEGCKEEVHLGELQHHLKDECAFSKVSCPNKGCEENVNRCELETHLIICDYQTATCTKGCGLQVNMNEISQHNCVAELKKVMEEQKSESASSLRDLKVEMESRLDSQRAHMVYKESSLQNQIDELKTQVGELLRETKSMEAKELQRTDEHNSVQKERKELLDWLKTLKYQDDLAEKYCGACNKRYLYVRKEPLTSFGESVSKNFIFESLSYVLSY
jgi:E3 ubiquitin-protein ligase NRDP1